MTSLDWLAAAPEIYLLLSACAFLLVGAFRKDSGDSDVGVSGKDGSLSGVVTLLVASLWLFLSPPLEGVYFFGMFLVSPFVSTMKSLALFASAAVLLMSIRFYKRENSARFEFSVLVLFSALGMMATLSANTLIALYLGLSLLALPLYVLAAFGKNSVLSSEAGIKYFILGALASGILLYGSSLVYGFTGSVDFGEISTLLQQQPVSAGLQIAMVFVITGLAFKVSAVPFHMWTPDVYQGTSTPVTAFFATAPKIAVLALIVRLFFAPFADVPHLWQDIFAVLAAASMVLGAFAAIHQRNIKRLLAYSSIGHVGTIFVGLAAGNETGVRACVLYMILYVIMNIGAFGCILSLRPHGKPLENIDSLKGLSQTRPITALGLGVLLFSLAGIPPLAGFFGKLYIFKAALEADLVFLAVIGVLSSAVAAFYYLRIVKLMYFDQPEEPLEERSAPEIAFLIALSSLGVVLFIFFPETLQEVVLQTTQEFIRP